MEEFLRDGPWVAGEDIRDLVDPVSAVFGTKELCGRVLVRDAHSVDADFQIVRTEHHAEDEFTAGVFGDSKFDRNVLLYGPLEFEIVVEAPSLPKLEELVQPLIGALEMARLGYVPVGGGKWRGAGWVPWEIGRMQLWRAGFEEVERASEGDKSMRTHYQDVLLHST